MWMDGKLRSLMEIIDEEEETIPTIEENKEMPKEDGWGNIPTIGEVEDW